MAHSLSEVYLFNYIKFFWLIHCWAERLHHYAFTTREATFVHGLRCVLPCLSSVSGEKRWSFGWPHLPVNSQFPATAVLPAPPSPCCCISATVNEQHPLNLPMLSKLICLSCLYLLSLKLLYSVSVIPALECYFFLNSSVCLANTNILNYVKMSYVYTWNVKMNVKRSFTVLSVSMCVCVLVAPTSRLRSLTELYHNMQPSAETAFHYKCYASLLGGGY